MTKLLSIALLFVALFPPAVAADTGRAALGRMKVLAGVWQAETDKASTTEVTFKLIASGAALVEEWKFPGGDASMTVYHLDGENLIATHFCPQENQPRLAFVGGTGDSEFTFQFMDGTGLGDLSKSHERKLSLRLVSGDRFVRREAYVRNGTPTEEADAAPLGAAVTFKRIASSTSSGQSRAAPGSLEK